MNVPALAKRIELWPSDSLRPYERNARTHSEEQIAQIAASILEFGFNAPVLVDTNAGVIAGHGRLLAARKLGLAEVPVVVLDHLTETQKRAYILADNRLAESAGWNEELLAEELAALEGEGFELSLIGFSDEELRVLLADDEAGQEEPPAAEEIPEALAQAVTQPGDVWLVGPHRLICGDCRDLGVVEKLMEKRLANVVITSPPYATQREYDPASGFKPIRPEEYTGWYRDVAANIQSVLAPEGSYFLNIKAHAEDGQRQLYVKKLVIAHVEQWGWRFVDEFCWRKTDNGVPGGWNNRFKNAWEPVFHFCRNQKIKFLPKTVGHVSEDCFDYSPDNPTSRSGSGLLGTGPRGSSASQPPQGSQGWGHMRRKLVDGRHEGIARPSNVIEVKTEKHVDLECGCIHIEQRNWHQDIDVPKTEKSRRTLALGNLVKRYRQWIAELPHKHLDAWVFPQADDPSKPVWDSGVRMALKKAAAAEGCDFEDLGPHSLRRANITWRQEVGGSSIEASKIAGHANTKITEEYTIVQLKRQEELTRRIQEKLAAVVGKKTGEAAEPTSVPGAPEAPPSLVDAKPATPVVQ